LAETDVTGKANVIPLHYLIFSLLGKNWRYFIGERARHYQGCTNL